MGMLQSYLLYYFIVCFTTLIVFLSDIIRKNNLQKLGKLLFFTAILLPALISGFRYGVGTDFFSYADKYYQISSNNDILYDVIYNRYEPGWVLLNHFVNFLFNDVKYFFLVTSLLIWIFNFKAIYENRKNMSIGIAVLILLCTLYNPSFNMIRQSLAASILMLSIKPIIEKRPFKFFFIIVFAFSIHYTSIIFLPAYWIANNRTRHLSFLKQIITVIGAILMVVIAPKLLSFITKFEAFSAYSHYQLDFEDFGIGNIILKLPIILLILINFKKLKNKTNPMYKVIMFYFIGLILEYYGYFAEYVGRISLYYEMIQVFILAAIIKVQTNKYEKLIYSLVIILYFLVWFTYNFIITNRHETNPYMWQ